MIGGLARGQYVRALTATYASLFLIRVAFGVSLVTFPLYVKGSDTTFSLVATSSPLLELITIVFAGVLIDKYGRKGVLLTGLASHPGAQQVSIDADRLDVGEPVASAVGVSPVRHHMLPRANRPLPPTRHSRGCHGPGRRRRHRFDAATARR